MTSQLAMFAPPVEDTPTSVAGPTSGSPEPSTGGALCSWCGLADADLAATGRVGSATCTNCGTSPIVRVRAYQNRLKRAAGHDH